MPVNGCEGQYYMMLLLALEMGFHCNIRYDLCQLLRCPFPFGNHHLSAAVKLCDPAELLSKFLVFMG